MTGLKVTHVPTELPCRDTRGGAHYLLARRLAGVSGSVRPCVLCLTEAPRSQSVGPRLTERGGVGGGGGSLCPAMLGPNPWARPAAGAASVSLTPPRGPGLCFHLRS